MHPCPCDHMCMCVATILLFWLPVFARKCYLLPAISQQNPHHWHLACGAENTLQAIQLIPAIQLPANHIHYSMQSHDCTNIDEQLSRDLGKKFKKKKTYISLPSPHRYTTGRHASLCMTTNQLVGTCMEERYSSIVLQNCL